MDLSVKVLLEVNRSYRRGNDIGDYAEANMNRNLKVGLLFTVMVLTILSLNLPCFAVNHVILDEHFDRNPEEHSWPWTTPGGYAWYFNTQNWPVPRNVGPPYSVCGWGWQDYRYSTQVIRRADYPGALWCAYSTRNGPQDPQWPDEEGDDEYWANMNAWAFWGPFDLREAVGGQASFWIRMEVEGFSYDSLTVCIEPGDDYLLLDGADFHEYCSIGKTFKIPTEDWQRNSVYFDSLFVNGEQVSYLKTDEEDGQRRCWLAFVWHSNAQHIAGKGAFIDDVVVVWDDGLVDIYPSNGRFGYVVSEDSVNWSSRVPDFDEEVYLRLDWKCEGSEIETAPFTVECYVNDELFYSEERQVVGSEDSTYTSITDELWSPREEGEYYIRWVLDSEEDVEEANEDNNMWELHFVTVNNPPPDFRIIQPDTLVTPVELETEYEVSFTLTDEYEEDQSFAVFIYWTTDTTGWAENPELMYDWHALYGEFAAQRGTHTAPITFHDAQLDSGDVVYIVGVANDGEPANNTYSIAPGSLFIMPWVDHDVDEGSGRDLPTDYTLKAVYPNPFNSMVSIDYALPVAGNMRLSAFDLRGRVVANLINGYSPAGLHTYSWHPDNLPGGVYLIRMNAGGQSFVQKVMYMP